MDKKIQPPIFQGGWFHVQHPPPNARKLIEHAEKNTQDWIDSSMYLSGSIDALCDDEKSSFIVTLGSDDEFEDSSDDSAEDDVDFDFTLDAVGEDSKEDSVDFKQPEDEHKDEHKDEDEGKDEDEEDASLPDLWVQCENKTCRKWRLLEEHWKAQHFFCRLFSGQTCTVVCDGCELSQCMCRCDKCHLLLRDEPCSCT